MPKVAMRIIAEARTRSLAGPSPPARQRAAVWDMLPLEGTPMGAASRFVMPSHISRLDLSKRWCDAFSMIRAAMLISMMPMAAMVSALSTTWPMMKSGQVGEGREDLEGTGDSVFQCAARYRETWPQPFCRHHEERCIIEGDARREIDGGGRKPRYQPR